MTRRSLAAALSALSALAAALFARPARQASDGPALYTVPLEGDRVLVYGANPATGVIHRRQVPRAYESGARRSILDDMRRARWRA